MNKAPVGWAMQVVVSGFCAGLAWWNEYPLEGTEFSGGRITGALLDINGIGIILLIVALIVTTRKRRIGALLTIMGAFLCLPLPIYFLAPGPFRRIFRGEYSVPLPGEYVWDLRWAFQACVLVFVFVISLRALLVDSRPDSPTTS